MNIAALFSLFFLSISSFVKASDLHDHHHRLHEHHAHARSLLDATSDQKLAIAWFANWHTDATSSFGLSSVTWSKYTQMVYSFVTVNESCQLAPLPNEKLLRDFVEQAHEHEVKALVAVGGWAGSIYFSPCVASEENRKTFVDSLLELVNKYNLDGINFDWEYPNQQGIGCNQINPDDTKNYCTFLEDLRKELRSDEFILSAATGITPFHGPDGKPITDVSSFAKVLTSIAIMQYDLWGPWSTSVGPNAPLYDNCASSNNQFGSAASAVENWKNAGMPPEKIVLGVPAYGHSFKVTHENAFVPGSDPKELAAYCTFDASAHPKGDSWDGNGPDACGEDQPYGGDFTFWGLIDSGFLDDKGKNKSGIFYRFDSCSKTPYVYNPDTEIMVSYDNAESFTAKGEFIKKEELAGFGMWEAGGDSKGDILLDAIRKGMGLN